MVLDAKTEIQRLNWNMVVLGCQYCSMMISLRSLNYHRCRRKCLWVSGECFSEKMPADL